MSPIRRLGGWGFAVIAALTFVTAVTQSSARAQVKPGDFITWDNAAKVKDLVSPGQYLRIVNGMTLKVVGPERIDWPPPYREATEKYSSQVSLSRDGRSLAGYVAGEPFPIIDANDEHAGVKIMWNVVFRPISSDDYDLRWFDGISVYWGRNTPYREIYYSAVGHYAGYNEVGRTEVDPMPLDPDFRITGRYYMFGLFPILAPATARGLGILKFRYAGPDREDDTWLWTPGSRRFRRLNNSMLDVAAGPLTYDPNHYQGFSGKNENYEFRFLGEKRMLAAVNVDQVPDRRCATDGGASHCPDPWELRTMYLVEARPRPGRFISLYSREVMYIDTEADFVMSDDMYNGEGELWKNETSWMRYADRAEPGARIAIYPFKREFQVGSSTVDVQSGFATVSYHPSPNAPSHESWFINMGAVNRNWFTPEQLVRAAMVGHGPSGD